MPGSLSGSWRKNSRATRLIRLRSQLAEKFAGDPFDPVALNRQPHIFFGYDQTQTVRGPVVLPGQK
jgi:hypothetical protein